MDDVDLLVIGSGFGGLTAGALGAATGLRTLVLEQHTRPGGCAGDFALDGFRFPAGATVITGLEEGGILRQVVDASGAEVHSSPLDPSIILHVDGMTLPYVQDHERWKAIFREAFPEAPDGYVRFWDWAHRVGGAVYDIGTALPSFPIQGLDDIRRSLPALQPGVVRTLPWLVSTVEAVKQRFGAIGHPPADRLIDGVLIDATGATSGTCSAVQGAIAIDLYRRGCQWVDGGPAAIAMALVRATRRSGGEVRFQARIERVRKRTGGWVARTADGDIVRARAVVANVPPQALDALLGRHVEREEDIDSWGAFVLHLGIDGAGLEGIDPFHQVLALTGEPLPPWGENAFVSIFPGRGTRWSVSVSTHTDVNSWELPTEEVARHRCMMEEALVDATARAIPDIQERIVLQRSAIPRTFEHYTLRPRGFVGGLVQRPGRSTFRAPGHRVAPGLALAGDHVFPGQGTVGVALSGINAYRDACQYIGTGSLL